MCAFDGWTRRGFARQIRRWTTPPLSNRTSLRSGGFANKSGLCRVSEVANLQLWVTRRFPKPSPKRDRVITKATAVSPLSPHCPSVLRPSRVFAGIFGYFCFQDKSDSPISLQSKRGETAFDLTDFASAKPCF